MQEDGGEWSHDRRNSDFDYIKHKRVILQVDKNAAVAWALRIDCQCLSHLIDMDL